MLCGTLWGSVGVLGSVTVLGSVGVLGSVAVLGSVTALGTVTLTPASVQAHETEVEGKIAATWHIEPNDAPEAGKPAQVWIALTRVGGQVIPLADCDCTLKIWSVPPGDQPLLEPDLTSISAEQYTGIPAAEVVFPDRGQYLLELSGTPRAGADFSPFTFKNQILVATGSGTAPTPSSETTGSTAPTGTSPASPPSIASGSPANPVPSASVPTIDRSLLLGALGGTIASVLAGIGGLWLFRKNQPESQTPE